MKQMFERLELIIKRVVFADKRKNYEERKKSLLICH